MLMLYLLTQTPPPVAWPTPTLPGAGAPPATAVLRLEQFVYVAPEGIVQGYHVVNQHDIFNYFWLMITVLVVFLGIWAVIRKIQAL